MSLLLYQELLDRHSYQMKKLITFPHIGDRIYFTAVCSQMKHAKNISHISNY